MSTATIYRTDGTSQTYDLVGRTTPWTWRDFVCVRTVDDSGDEVTKYLPSSDIVDMEVELS